MHSFILMLLHMLIFGGAGFVPTAVDLDEICVVYNLMYGSSYKHTFILTMAYSHMTSC